MTGVLWSLGLMTFFLVYNLYLIDLGFNEALIGQISAAMTTGSLAITLPAGLLLNRYGLNRFLQASVLTTAVTLLFRAISETVGALILSAFLSGASVGAWMVAAPPFLACNTRPEFRSRAFSLSYAISIGMGVAAGLLVGIIPWAISSWLGLESLPPLLEKRYLLLACSAVVLSSLFFLTFLRETPEEHRVPQELWWQGRIHSVKMPSREIILRILIVLAFWSLFVGSFPPFFNVFFHTRYRQSLEGIGLIFSLSQFCQVLATLSMPWAILKLGRIPAIVSMQVAASFFLPLLLLTNTVQLAGVLYLTYLSFQVMCEPALENFIMDSVLPEERNLVSALRYTTLFLMQAIGVWASGAAITLMGYSTLLIVLSILGLAAATSLYFFFHRFKTVQAVT